MRDLHRSRYIEFNRRHAWNSKIYIRRKTQYIKLKLWHHFSLDFILHEFRIFRAPSRSENVTDVCKSFLSTMGETVILCSGVISHNFFLFSLWGRNGPEVHYKSSISSAIAKVVKSSVQKFVWSKDMDIDQKKHVDCNLWMFKKR